MNLDSVAVKITKDLGEVVFVGAFAVITHVGTYRQTRDIDLAVASPISDNRLEELGYRVFQEGRKRVIRTQDGVKMDIYTDDVSGIAVPKIFETAITRRIGADEIRVMGLEALLIAKMRASRDQDIEDLQQLCRVKGRSIRWDVVESMAAQLEVSNLRNTVRALSR